MRYVPNLLSAGRLLAVIPIVWLILINTPATYAWATVIYFFSAVSDTVDGRIARRFKLVSKLGVFLDLTADKGFVISILVALVQVGLVPAWITIIITLREFVVQGMRTLAASDNVIIPAGNLGKQKTFFSLLGIGGILLGRAFDGHTWFVLGLASGMHGPQSFGDWLLFTANAVLLLAVVWTILSAVEYLRGGWQFLVGSATGRG